MIILFFDDNEDINRLRYQLLDIGIGRIPVNPVEASSLLLAIGLSRYGKSWI